MATLEALKATAAQFIAWDINAETRGAAAALLARADADPAPLAAAFGSRLEFGTAGLRAPMGPGYARMNDLTVLQTAQVGGRSGEGPAGPGAPG